MDQEIYLSIVIGLGEELSESDLELLEKYIEGNC